MWMTITCLFHLHRHRLHLGVSLLIGNLGPLRRGEGSRNKCSSSMLFYRCGKKRTKNLNALDLCLLPLHRTCLTLVKISWRPWNCLTRSTPQHYRFLLISHCIRSCSRGWNLSVGCISCMASLRWLHMFHSHHHLWIFRFQFSLCTIRTFLCSLGFIHYFSVVSNVFEQIITFECL